MVRITPSTSTNNESRILVTKLLGPLQDEFCNKSAESIYQRLQKFFNCSDTELDPSRTINGILTDLVSHLQGTGFLDERFYSTVEWESCKVIDQDEELLKKANAIREVAVRAETRMEFYYNDILLTAAKNLELESDLSFVERIKVAADLFLYTDNYVDMVDVEADVLSWFWERSGRKGDMHIAFCGSGPLPLTGLLLAVCLGAEVTLIDCCPDAIEASKKLVERWEEIGVIPSGRITHMCANGADVQFVEKKKGEKILASKYGNKYISCDVVFLAALIPNKVKENMAKNVSDLGDKGPLVVLRSAHGLTSRFAYYRTRRSILTQHLSLVGVIAPESHHLGNGNIVDDTEKPLKFFPSNILNSLELYTSNDIKTFVNEIE